MPTLPVWPLRRRAGDEFREAVVADFDDAFVDENVAGFEVAVDDAVVVKVGDAGSDAVDPSEGFVERQAVGVAGDYFFERFTGHEFHDDPVVALVILANVV